MDVFSGLSAFPITPANASGRVDLGAMGALLDRLRAGRVDSIGLLGSTGTYAYLSRAERRRTLDGALAAIGDSLPILVGVGALRTDEAVAMARDARDAGAAAGLLAAVSYTPLTEDEVFAHVVAVAEGSELPICIYDNPSTTHFRFSPALLARLAGVSGIRAVKAPTTDPDAAVATLATLRSALPAGFRIGFSGDWNVHDALIAGADAWYSVAAGLFPAPCVALVRAARAGDAAGARLESARLEPLWALFRAHSSLRVVYAAAAILGITAFEPPRPIQPLPESVRSEVGAVMRALDLG